MTKKPYRKPRRWRRVFGGTILVLIVFYLLLSLPPSDPVLPNMKEKAAFLWDQDELWTALEMQFQQARQMPCTELSLLIDSSIHQITGLVETIAGDTLSPAALLFESGAYRKLDMTILVNAPVKLRIERIMKRDKLKHRQVYARMSSQIKPEEALKLADHVIINDDRTFVLPQILEIHQKIRREGVI